MGEKLAGEGKSTKHSVAVEKWRQLGIDLGMIDPDDPDLFGKFVGI